MKKIVSIILSILMLGGCMSLTACSTADYTVGILQLAQHGALDSANKGFRDKLTELLKADGKTVKFDNQNAAGEDANNATIAANFVSKKVDLIYSIATSSSQAVAAATEEIPIIFSSVTDPVDAGLVASVDAPGKNVTGVSDLNPISKQIDLIKRMFPAKSTVKIGFLYTAAETNSIVQVNIAKAYCDTKGYTYVEQGLSDMSDVAAALQSLSRENVDAVYIPTDNKIANAPATVASENEEIGLPIVCGEAAMTEVCGVATYGVDYYSIGEAAGQMAYDILVKGVSPATIPVGYDENPTLMVYEANASAISFTIPDEILAEANAD